MEDRAICSLSEIALVQTICRLYEELMHIDRSFLGDLEDGLPGEGELGDFAQARGSLVATLEPLLDRQSSWLNRCDKAQLDWDCQRAVDQQLRHMQEFEKLEGVLLTQLATFREILGKKVAGLHNVRRAFGGYRGGSKVAPRFCQRAV